MPKIVLIIEEELCRLPAVKKFLGDEKDQIASVMILAHGSSIKFSPAGVPETIKYKNVSVKTARSALEYLGFKSISILIDQNWLEKNVKAGTSLIHINSDYSRTPKSLRLKSINVSITADLKDEDVKLALSSALNLASNNLGE
jgi:hypothetical protein